MEQDEIQESPSFLPELLLSPKFLLQLSKKFNPTPSSSFSWLCISFNWAISFFFRPDLLYTSADWPAAFVHEFLPGTIDGMAARARGALPAASWSLRGRE